MDVDGEHTDQSRAADYHFHQALLFEEREEYEKALVECDAAVKVGRSFLAQMHNLRAIVLEELEREEKAMVDYKKALILDPSFQEAADNLRELESELGHDLVTIARFSHPTKAHIARAKLEAKGIWAFVADEHLIAANWLYSNAVGGVKLQVSERNAERALEILGIYLDRDESGKDEVKDEQVECPQCGSTNVRYERYALRPVFTSWLILPAPLPFLKRKWKCRDCGYEWKRTMSTR